MGVWPPLPGVECDWCGKSTDPLEMLVRLGTPNWRLVCKTCQEPNDVMDAIASLGEKPTIDEEGNVR